MLSGTMGWNFPRTLLPPWCTASWPCTWHTFTAIGREWPEHFATLEAEAARFMQLNNTVVLSVRCWGLKATAIACCVGAVVAAGVGAVRAIRA